MPSRTLLSILVVCLLATVGSAAPKLPRSRKDRCSAPSITIPSSSLPAPAANVTLKHVALGVGYQNYTCSAAGAVPVSHGAIAVLYDAMSFLMRNESLIPSLPVVAFNLSRTPDDSSSDPSMSMVPGFSMPQLGRHFFNQDLVPVFDLFKACPAAELIGKKVRNVAAPPASYSGSAGEGAVDWLYLSDAGGSTGDVSSVYRIETAGGKAPATCDGTQELTVPYAAEYWFYGPAS